MATFTPTAAEQAVLNKRKKGQTLTPNEVNILNTMSKREWNALYGDSAPRQADGSGGQYDYKSGVVGGFNYGSVDPLMEGYNNFMETEMMQRSQGLPARQLPIQYINLALQNNPLGYDLTNPSSFYTPVKGTAGWNELIQKGVLSQDGQLLVNGSPVGAAPSGNLGSQSASLAGGGTVTQSGGTLLAQSFSKPSEGTSMATKPNDPMIAALINRRNQGGVLSPQEQKYLQDYAGITSASNSTNVTSQPVLRGDTPWSSTVVPTPQVNPGVPTSTSPGSFQIPGLNTPATPITSGSLVRNATPSPTQTITSPGGGIQGGIAIGGVDEGKLLAEAELQKQLRQQSFEGIDSARAKYLSDLSTLLQQQQTAAFTDSLPGVYEDLNTRGLLRSSALGDRLAQEQSKLARQTSEQLALQGLTDRRSALDQIGAIQEAYLGNRGQAIQRRFSLEDYDRQLKAAKEIGATTTPQISQPSAKGSSALTGGLGGATIGAQVGGGPGAAIGGLVGTVTGGQLGSK